MDKTVNPLKVFITLFAGYWKGITLIPGDWNTKIGSEEIPGVTGKLDLGVKNESGQRLTEFCQENALVIANTLFQQDEKTTHQIDYILCSRRWRSSIQSAKRQDWELTVAQIMNSLL